MTGTRRGLHADADADADHVAGNGDRREGAGGGDAAVEPVADRPAQPWGWHVVRVSGLFLAALITWHVIVTFVLNDVGQTTAVSVSNHWRDATWRGLEWVTLVLALLHGGVGLDAALRRRSWDAAVRSGARIVSALVVGALAVAASVVVLGYR